MVDAKILLAEEIKSILKEFGFIGEIAGPQERRKLIWYYWLIISIHITGQQLQLLQEDPFCSLPCFAACSCDKVGKGFSTIIG